VTRFRDTIAPVRGRALLLLLAIAASTALAREAAPAPPGPLRETIARIRDHYVDPERIDPRAMLSAALDEIQRSVAEVMVRASEGGGDVTVQVSDHSRAFRVSDVTTLDALGARTGEIVDFVRASARPGTDGARIEYAAINGMLSTLDPHSTLLDPEDSKEMGVNLSGKFGGLGIVIRMRKDPATGEMGVAVVGPVPRGLPTRRQRSRPGQGVPLTRRTRRLPKILNPGEVDALTAALRTHRDRAMVAAMVLGGLRRCEVLGLRMEDLRVGERRVFIAEGKGGHQRLVPVSARFFVAVQAYLQAERPPGLGTDSVSVVLKGPRRGQPLAVRGLDEILSGARRRAGLDHATCHELRHTCLTRLREAGMALEAVQAQAGHASIEPTWIYLHLADDWLASQYRKAAEVIDA